MDRWEKMMKSTIQKHIDTYPLMEVRDVCKLIYQSIFGGGHMIPNPEYSLKRLREEYESMKDVFGEEESKIEEIGEDVSRMYLNTLKNGLSPETLNQMFVLSANKKKGTGEELEEVLALFLKDCEDCSFPFSYGEAADFIEKWKKEGYPAISHSETYRNSYLPAYRVIERDYGKYYKVFLEIDCLLEKAKNEDRPLVVCIDGMAGSGKSTLAALLKEIYDCNLFHMDDYFLRPQQRTEERLAEPGGNVDYERFKNEVYDKIDCQTDFAYQIYDCSKQALGESVEVSYKKLNIIEGAYSMHPYFEDRADLVFFMEISAELQKERIGARNGEWMLNRFLTEWIPMEHRYFNTYGIRDKGIVIFGDC